MKRTLLLLIVPVLLLALLSGCGQRAPGGSASNGDLQTAQDETSSPGTATAASTADDSALATSGDLTSGEPETLSPEGSWRSEQQDAGSELVVVRTLELAKDGSFSYREGDAYSEFSYFASGFWTCSSNTLHVLFVETDELGATLSDDSLAADYLLTPEEGGISLTQTGAVGFADGTEGLAVHYYQP